uniref:SFRICE_014836 n=1 Tax=Spodoptera frugiperda TaxID=7108 RepID=A0A2H1VMH0_SPOFR
MMVEKLTAHLMIVTVSFADLVVASATAGQGVSGSVPGPGKELLGISSFSPIARSKNQLETSVTIMLNLNN